MSRLARKRPRSRGGPRCGCRSRPRERARRCSSRKILAFPLAHTGHSLAPSNSAKIQREMKRREQRVRVLVAIVAETRAWEITAESFISHVLEPLQADLALCVGDHEDPNPLYDRAKFVWRSPEPDDWGELYDRKAGGSRWRILLKPWNQLLGGIEDPEIEEIGSGAIVVYFRQFLAESIERAGIGGDYDWLVVTRSDLLWPVPHPSTRFLSGRHIYALDGEGYGGVGDRHLIVPRRFVDRFLEVPEPIFSDPERLKRRLDRISVAQDWVMLNPERYLGARLKELGLARRLRFLPYVPYAVRPPGGATRWAEGVFDEERGYYVKYPTELERSRIAQRFVSDQESWGRYLAPIRGARLRRELRAAYRERDLYERPFPPSQAHVRAARRLGHFASNQRKRMQHLLVRIARPLRRIPAIASLLDARVRRLRRR